MLGTRKLRQRPTQPLRWTQRQTWRLLRWTQLPQRWKPMAHVMLRLQLPWQLLRRVSQRRPVQLHQQPQPAHLLSQVQLTISKHWPFMYAMQHTASDRTRNGSTCLADLTYAAALHCMLASKNLYHEHSYISVGFAGGQASAGIAAACAELISTFLCLCS